MFEVALGLGVGFRDIDGFACFEQGKGKADFAIEFSDLNNIGALPIEFIVTLVELFSRCEKQTDGAFMFRSMLNLCRQYLMGEKDYYQLVGTSKRV